MRSTIGLLVASLALAACGASGDAPGAGAEATPERTEATAAVTTSTRLLQSDADDRPETPTTTTPTQAPGATITIENFSFGSPLTVGVGDSLNVVNEDGVPHTWTSGDGVFDSGTL